MMSIEYMQDLVHEAAVQAAEEGMEPFVYATNDEVGQETERGLFPFPFIGDYEPEGWTKVDEHFVDASGFGRPGEPALTIDAFLALIKEKMRAHAAERKSVGWAVTVTGQFQVYVGEFTKGV